MLSVTAHDSIIGVKIEALFVLMRYVLRPLLYDQSFVEIDPNSLGALQFD